jgi:hypothetical protein
MNYWLWAGIFVGGLVFALITNPVVKAIRARQRSEDDPEYDPVEDAAQYGVISFLVDLFLW